MEQVRKNENTEKYTTMKEKGRNSQDQINKEEMHQLPEKEFRVIIKMIQNLENRTEIMKESMTTFNKDLKEIKKKQR